MAVQIQIRRGLAANWTSVNPILADGEIGIETDTLQWKIGNGTDSWTALAYASAPSDGVNILAAGTQTANTTGTVLFQNSNGISFGMSQSSQITASHNGLTTAALSNHSHGNPTLALTNLSGTTASASNGFTLSLSAGAGGAGDGVNILAAGTQTANTTGTVLFDNANGITFGMNNSSVITASHNALTTAMASNRGSDFVAASAAFAGTSASGTIASNGISVSIGPYITTAMLSDAVTLSNIRVSGGTTSNLLSAITFGDANGVSFGLNAGTMTASHNALTSQSNQALSAANGSFTFQTATFANSNGVSFSTGTQGLYATVKTDYLTTAALSNHSHGVSFTSGSVAFQTLSFTNSNGISFNSGTQGIFASHNALTTARASNDAIGLNTALTAGPLAWTVNSSGLSLNAGSAAGTTTGFGGNLLSASMTHNTAGLNLSLNHPAWLTTAAQSNHSHGNPTLNLTNLSGTTASNSAGFTLSLSAAAPGGGGAINVSAGTTSGNLQTLQFDNANGISFQLNGSTVTASHNGLTTAAASDHSHGNPTLALTNLSGTTASASNGFTLSLSAGAAGGGQTYGMWEVFPMQNNTTFSSLGQNSLYLQKLRPQQAYSFNFFERRMSGSFVSSTNSQVVVHTINYGLYSRDNATRVTQCGSSQMIVSASYNSNTAMGFTISQGAASFTTTSGGTAIASLMTGFKHLYLPFTSTMSAGTEYWFGMAISSATTVGTSPLRLAMLELTNINNLTIGKVYATTLLASNTSHVGDFNEGVFSVTTGGLPSTIADNQITNAISQARMYLQVDV